MGRYPLFFLGAHLLNLVLTELQALNWVARCLGLALVQQSFEYLWILPQMEEQGSWEWSILRRDFLVFPKIMVIILDSIFRPKIFRTLVIMQLTVAGLVFFSPVFELFPFLLISHLLICLRWRGTFNGGSDFMTTVVLTGLTLASFFGHTTAVIRIALDYIAFQSILSYWIAGIAKLMAPNWRSGRALLHFLEGSWLQSRMNLKVSLSVTLMILLFESSFPMVVIRPEIAMVYIAIAFCFHFANAAILGLNRFVLPWLATYPAILYLSQS